MVHPSAPTTACSQVTSTTCLSGAISWRRLMLLKLELGYEASMPKIALAADAPSSAPKSIPVSFSKSRSSRSVASSYVEPTSLRRISSEVRPSSSGTGRSPTTPARFSLATAPLCKTHKRYSPTSSGSWSCPSPTSPPTLCHVGNPPRTRRSTMPCCTKH